ncbi:unnamed protein product [Cylindrotheca closterium]|uniref:Uncharacterized protein n=1 Tax=Cylindrotheca closterium TaxID=2856 RepID=A0AAD2CKC2_9STRA|nr:unnamed protein product [Cylindrotheca closterium]
MMQRKLSICLIFLGMFLGDQCNGFVIPTSRFASHTTRNGAAGGGEVLASSSSSSSSFTALSAAATVSATTEKIPNQILKFQEPTTNVTVILVGAMHYNPSSIQLAEDTIERLASNQQLASVIVESCDIRWNKTLALYEKQPWLKQILKNEMVASSDLARQYKRPVILGDQRINITTDSIKECFQETVMDLKSPPSGWKRFALDVGQAVDETRPFGGEGYLSAFAFFDPQLILAFPVSLVKYPLSFLVRDPVPTSILFLGFFGLNYLEASGVVGGGGGGGLSTSTDFALEAIQNNEVPITDWIVSVSIAILEIVFFARAFLKPLLAERNQVLARSILDQCQLLAGARTSGSTSAAKNKTPSNSWSLPWPFAGDASPQSNKKAVLVEDSSTSNSEIVYASGSSADVTTDGGGAADQTVVAILGMAHCNGIKKLLQDELVI